MSVSNQIIEVIDALCEKFGIVIDFTTENIMPQLEILCAKFINYEIYTSIFWIMFVVIMCSICWIIFGMTFKKAKEVEWDEDYVVTWINIIICIIAVLMSIVFVFVISAQIYDIIQAITFPEKTIFDYINNLINTNHL